MTLQAVGKYGADKAKIAENEKTVIDWEHWEAAIDDPVVGEMKAVYEDLMKDAEAKLLPAFEKDQQELLAKLNEQFEGAVRPASPSAPAPLPHPTAPPPFPTLPPTSARLTILAAHHIRPRHACRRSLRPGRRRPRAWRAWRRPSRT